MKVVTKNEFEGRTSDLLREASDGEVLQIRDGETVYELKVISRSAADEDQIWKAILERRATRPVITQAEWAQWKHEGHRY